MLPIEMIGLWATVPTFIIDDDEDLGQPFLLT